jgi:hypothetical protein
MPSKTPFFLVWSLIDQHILALVLANTVVIQLLIVVRPLVFDTLFRRVVAAIVKSRTVVRPRGTRELDPLQVVLQVPTRVYLAYVPLLPI